MASRNPRLFRAGRAIERRIFLKALAVGLAAPVAAKLSRIATAAPTGAPKRFFLFYMPHGIAPEHYNPQVSAGDRTEFALDQTNVSILGPLEKYKSSVNVYQGFAYPGGATHTGIVSCLSGAPPNPDTTTPRTSFEQVMARSLGVKPWVLGACSHLPYGLDSNGMLFWNGTPIDPEKNPAKVADTLFGAAKPAQPVSADVQLRSDLLKLTAAEVQSLHDELRGLTSEETKLERHLSALQTIQSGAGGAGKNTCTMAPSLPAVDAVRAASAGQVIDPSGGNDYFYQEKNFPLLLQAQLQVVAQALVCNAAQVVSLMPMYATCDFNFSFSQPSAAAPPTGWSHHAGLSHTNPQAAGGAAYNSPLSVANFNPDTRAAFARAQLWFSQQLTQYVIDVLATTDDPSAPGSRVLDNTLVYWMSEIGDGAQHTTQSQIIYPQVPSFLPLVSIGKAGGALKTGQVVRFDTDRPAADLYLSFCQAMGASGVSFPGQTGPVTEVLA